jgi:hypothetical protein
MDLVEEFAKAMAEADAVKIAPGMPWPWSGRSKTVKERFRLMARAGVSATKARRGVPDAEDYWS